MNCHSFDWQSAQWLTPVSTMKKSVLVKLGATANLVLSDEVVSGLGRELEASELGLVVGGLAVNQIGGRTDSVSAGGADDSLD